MLGTGTGSFSAATNFAAPSPDFVAVGDFNGDSKVDLVVTSVNSSDVTILLGTGTGSFSTAAFPLSTSPSVAVGDFNGDSKLDLAVANAGLSILPTWLSQQPLLIQWQRKSRRIGLRPTYLERQATIAI